MNKFIALVCTFILMSCASLSTDRGQQVAARIGVQYATLKIIDGDADRASSVVEVVDRAIALAEGEPVSIDDLEAQIRDAIPWNKLDDADYMLAEVLILQIREELDVRVVDGLIDPERAAAAVEVLRWVRDAAVLAAK